VNDEDFRVWLEKMIQQHHEKFDVQTNKWIVEFWDVGEWELAFDNLAGALKDLNVMTPEMYNEFAKVILDRNLILEAVDESMSELFLSIVNHPTVKLTSR
jgi:hypothetical protein